MSPDHQRCLLILAEAKKPMTASEVRDEISRRAEESGWKFRAWYQQHATVTARLHELLDMGLLERFKAKAKDRHGKTKYHYKLSRLGRKVLKRLQLGG